MLNFRLVSQHCESLVKYIDHIYKSEIEVLIRNRAKEGRMNKSECWSELRHVAGRLLSYLRAAKTLVSTSKLWPELFENYVVCYIASSVPGQYIFKGKHSPEKMSAELIVRCMTSDLKKLEEYKAHAQELQKFKLDESIRIKTSKQKFRPIVHAEVLLLDWLERDCGTLPTRFFNGYKYIGCSKPTCRLCEHYFSVHASGVEVRSAHRNLYPNWRMPDVYEDQGPHAAKDREKLMGKILELVRKDAFRVLVEKVPEGKRHDSNTDPTYQIDSIYSGRTDDVEHLEASLKGLDFDSSDHEAICSPTKPGPFGRSKEFTPDSDDDDDDADDDGGVSRLSVSLGFAPSI
jgi:OTT_1508-like deaminase